jgi:transposase
VAAAIALAQDFCAIGCARQANRFKHGLARTVGSGVAPLRRVATGLRTDADAGKASLRLPWSPTPLAGHINRLTRLQRSLVGRATSALLRRRFLLAA